MRNFIACQVLAKVSGVSALRKEMNDSTFVIFLLSFFFFELLEDDILKNNKLPIWNMVGVKVGIMLIVLNTGKCSGLYISSTCIRLLNHKSEFDCWLKVSLNGSGPFLWQGQISMIKMLKYTKVIRKVLTTAGLTLEVSMILIVFSGKDYCFLHGPEAFL